MTIKFVNVLYSASFPFWKLEVAFNWCGSTALRWWSCIGFSRGEFKDWEKWGRRYFECGLG